MVEVSHDFQNFIAKLCHRYVSHNVNLNTNVVGRVAMKQSLNNKIKSRP